MDATDPITHGLIGVSLSVLSGHPPQLNDPVFLGLVIGAVIPDIDIIAHYKGRLNYLLKHRGASHSFLALGGMALGISTILYAFLPQTSWNTIFFWTLAGTFSHGISDLLNSFGAELLWPFYKKKLSANMVMLADPVIFTLFLVSGTITFIKPEVATLGSLTAIFLAIFYVSYRELSRQKTKESLAKIFALDKQDIKVIPAMYRPFSWNFLLLQKNLVRFGTFQDKEPVVKQIFPMWNQDDPHIINAFEGAVADIFQKFTPYYHVIQSNDQTGSTIEFFDLRYWVKEDFVYSGKVKLDKEGNIARETFHWESRSNGVMIGY